MLRQRSEHDTDLPPSHARIFLKVRERQQIRTVLFGLFLIVSSCGLSSAASWSSLAPTTGHAVGGYDIVVSGSNFLAVSGLYECVFTCASTGDSVSAAASVDSSSQLTCTAPAWNLKSCITDVTITSNTTVSGSGNFQYVPGWLVFDPPAGPSSGGTLLSILGAGFDLSATYTCKFTGTSLLPFVTTAPASPNSPTALSCLTPAWPAWDTPGQASLSIQENSVDITQAVAISPLFTFSSGGWTSASPSSAFTNEGVTLTVAGFGFDPAATDYSIIFSSGQFQLQDSCSPQSTTVLHCPISAWMYGEMSVAVNLYKSSSIVGKSGGSFSFQFIAYWDGYTGARVGPVSGGTNITVTGHGFRTKNRGLAYVMRWTGVHSGTTIVTDGEVQDTTDRKSVV